MHLILLVIVIVITTTTTIIIIIIIIITIIIIVVISIIVVIIVPYISCKLCEQCFVVMVKVRIYRKEHRRNYYGYLRSSIENKLNKSKHRWS